MDRPTIIWTAILIENEYRYTLWQSVGMEYEQRDRIRDLFGKSLSVERLKANSFKFLFNDGKIVFLSGYEVDSVE